MSYFAWSYAGVGAIFLLVVGEWTPYLYIGLAVALLCLGLARKAGPAAVPKRGGTLARGVLIVTGLLGFQFLSWQFLYFFRDPDRVVPAGPVVVSPADGYVVYVRPVRGGEVPLAIKNGAPIPLEEVVRLGELGRFREGHIIGVFMTPMSVHVNRSPVDGVIRRRAYFRGQEMSSMLPMLLRTVFRRRPFEAGAEHIVRNERETLWIEGEVAVLMTRIADPYVNKIVTWKREGDRVRRGDRVGLIKMGSQADVVLPAAVSGRPIQIEVKEGQYVYGGSTVIARYGD